MFIMSVDENKKIIFCHSCVRENKDKVKETVTENTKKVHSGAFEIIESENLDITQ